MAKYRFKENQEFSIEWNDEKGREYTIDFLVSSIKGNRWNKSATLDVGGIKDLPRIYLGQQSRSIKKITNEIFMRIPIYYEPKGNNVEIYFNMPEHYWIYLKEEE